MRRIQFILNNRFLYGANRSILSVIEDFISKGHQVTVLVPFWGSMADELKKKEIPYEVIPFYSAFLYIRPILKHILVPILILLDILIFPFIIFRTWQFNPDIIYSNTSAENSGIFLAKILGKKHVWHIREFMKNDYKYYFIFGEKNKSRLINKSNKSIYVSNSVLNAVHEKNDEHKHIVIYNGIDSGISELSKLKVDLSTPVFGMVGVLDPAKGYELAFRYFKSILDNLPRSKLFIYGDKEGGYKDKLVSIANSLDISDAIEFKGFVNSQKEIYSSIDVLLMFSRSEGFGRVTIESSLYGIPVIGYDNAGTSELIEDKQSGCLFYDKDEFISSVSFLMNQKNYNTVRKNAFNRSVLKYNVDLYCSKVYKTVSNL